MALTKLLTDLIDGSLGTDWQSTVKTADFTAVAGQGYFVDTTSAAITVTLPSSPSAGDELTIVDYAGTADTNNITITSSDNINGTSINFLINYERGGVSMVYVDATQGWIAYNATNETATGLASALPPLTVDYLVVAGGGGTATGNYSSGGGGAGGLRTSYNDNTVSALNLVSSTNYTVTVGAGGAAVANYAGGSGVDSTFSTITSAGGGGGYGSQSNGYGDGADGGSGGGGSGEFLTSGGLGNNPSVTPSQGNDGGGGGTASAYAGGGGGGAGAAGTTATSSAGGNGGIGKAVNILNITNAATASVGEISGSDVYYAGGGGAASEGTSTPGTGGIGGGGNGGSDSNGGSENGTPNTGGGGGGRGTYGGPSVGRDGGSGVVILRYPSDYSIAVGSGIIEASGSPFTEGTDKVSVFTGGTGTISFS